MDKHLEHIRIVEVAYRLPGPLTGLYLQQLGAEVIRFEDCDFQDPFKKNEQNPIFESWYKNLNKNKEIVVLEKIKLQETLKKSDILILSLPQKQKEKWGLDREALKSFDNLCVIELGAKEPAHDLNIISQTKVFKFFLDQKSQDSMPFLPFAGMALAWQASLKALTLLIKKANQKQKSILFEKVDIKDSAVNVLDPLCHDSFNNLGNERRFLHTGAYPCYQIYKTKDGHAILACVEEKFWKLFCEKYNFSFNLEDRFDRTGKIKRNLIDYFKFKTNQQLQNQLGDAKACVNFI